MNQTKKLIAPIYRGVRRLSGSICTLPDFLIIGAQKAGTTSLHKYLLSHPCIAHTPKEIHFFDLYFSRGLSYYKSFFPSIINKTLLTQVRSSKILAGEATPYYLFHPRVAERVAQVLPNVKLIAVLRDPVDRAYSHYNYMLKKGKETLKFEEAIAKEEERLEFDCEKILNEDDYFSYSHQHHSYLSRGIYIEQIKRWHSFFPKEQMLIIDSKRLKLQTEEVLSEVLSFLSLPYHPLLEQDKSNYKKHNVNHYPSISKDTRNYLIDYFTPHNCELYNYLGVTFEWQR